MPLNSFTPNTKIESAKVNANTNNFSDHSRHVNLQWLFLGTLITQTSKDVKILPDDVTWNRIDLIAGTAPTGATIIVDIERSTDGGGTWVTIFTGGTNRPVIAISAKTGNSTTIDVPSAVGNNHLFRAKISQVGSTIAGADLSIILKGDYDLD